MKMYALGGFREVGRNAVLLETSHERILLDYGVKVETGEFPLKPEKTPNALILCHPHLDHCGSIPALYRKKAFPLFGTAATLDQSHLLWVDSMKVAKLKKRQQPFTLSDIERARSQETIITFGQEFEIGRSLIETHFAGHVPGSIMPVIESDGNRVLYTSDFNTISTRLLNGANAKEFKNIDALITETTYAYKEHPPREETEKLFLEAVEETIDNGGIALIPVFAVGRAAEILMVLNSIKPKFPIYLDGMAREATEIILHYPELLRDPRALKDAFEKSIPIYTDEEREEILSSPCAIVTTGGCIEGGPVSFYLNKLYSNSKSSLLFTGYQIPHTAGRFLLETGRYRTQNIDVKVKMNVQNFDFSAHIGRTQLLEFIKKLRPGKIICMHGDNCQEFAAEIKNNIGIDAVAPESGDVIKLF